MATASPSAAQQAKMARYVRRLARAGLSISVVATDTTDFAHGVFVVKSDAGTPVVTKSA